VPFVLPDDVHALQLAVQTEAVDLDGALNRAIVAGVVSPSAPIIDEWGRMLERVRDFLRENPSWLNTASQMNRGEQLQRELGPWHARMAAAGVPSVPQMPPQPAPAGDLFANVENIVIAIAVIMALREFGR
jgi:hypothetical protein